MKPYRVGAGRRVVNYVTKKLIGLGLARHYELLTMTGRTTGRPRSTRSGLSATKGRMGRSPPTGRSRG